MLTTNPYDLYAGDMASRETIGVQEARDTFRKRLDDAIEQGVQTVITRHGRPVAALVPIDWFRRAADALGEPVEQ